MSILGTEVRRLEDPRLLLGQGEFMADLSDARLDGAVHLAFARSMYAHGEILEVDAADALEMPGVIAVFTAADVDLVPAQPGGAGAPIEMARPWLATGRVRFVGEPVAVVVAETAVQAADAAEMVIVDIEPLPAVVGIERAGSDDDLLFPDVGSNVNSTMDDGWDARSDEELWEGCDVVVRATVVNQRLAALPLEGRGSAAFFVDGRLTQWVSTQAPHGCRTSLATAHGLGRDEVHVIAPDVGGGFGAKINPSPEDVLVGWVARRIGRPARWVETRSENLLAMSQGRDQVHDVAIGGTRDGRVLAYELDITADCGAYPLMGTFLPYFTRLMAPGVYDIERVRTRCRAVVTNTVPTEAFRGAGRPEAAATVERAMDLFAAEVGLDPAELRRRNLIPPERFPLTTPSGAAYDNGEYEQSLDLALETADYAGLRAEQQKRRLAGDVTQLGIGVAMYVEITGAGVTSEFGGVRLALDDDGEVSATVLTGASPHGQGLVTSYTMLASDRLGIPMERISVVHGDTDQVSWGFGTMGSRSLQIGGSAVLSAADGVIDAARELAATELEAAPADIVLDTACGAFHVAGTPARSVPWARVVRTAADSMSSAPDGASTDPASTDAASTDGADTDGNPLWVEGRFDTAGLTFPFGCHIAVVEVDTQTGRADLIRFVACDDAGRVLNPLLAAGQRHGGIAQGVAQALFEHVRYDTDGNPLTSTLADYGIPSAADLPGWELVTQETPTPMNPLGAKGIGESGTVGATPAVQSAVIDAVSHLGVRHIDLPLFPERVWRAIDDAST